MQCAVVALKERHRVAALYCHGHRACPRHHVARQHLRDGVALHHPNPPALTLTFISGEVSEPRKLSPPQHKLALALLQLTAAYLDQVSTDRQTDPALRTLHFNEQAVGVPD